MSDSELLTRLRDVPGPEPGSPPVATIVEAGRRKARERRLAVGALVLMLSVPLLWSLWGLAGISRGRDPAIRSGGDTSTEPPWPAQTRALMESVKAWGPGATFPDAPCSPGGTNLTLGTRDSDVLGFVPSCLAVPSNTSFTISYTNSITATNGDPSSLGFSLYESPSDAFILGDRETPWTVTSETRANALFRGENVSSGKTTRYEVRGLESGVYYFQDDLHPLAMNGVLVVLQTANEAGISFTRLRTPSGSKEAEAKAVETAQRSIGAVANKPRVHVSVRYGRLTDSDYTSGSTGQQSPLYVNRLVWLVTFDGVDVPGLGPGASGHANAQMNVVVDARTGEYLEAYSTE